MKKLIYLLAYCFFIVVTACGGNKKAEEKSLLIMQDSVDACGLQRMQVSKADVDIKFKGKDYHSFISRTPDEDLPLVKDDRGNQFVDNKIQLRLTRGNEQIFNDFYKEKFCFNSGRRLFGKVYFGRNGIQQDYPARNCICCQCVLSADGLVCSYFHNDYC